jgi:Outer membrane protein beta-barrel domain
MKQISILFILFINISTCIGQFSQGTTYLEGSANISTSGSKTDYLNTANNSTSNSNSFRVSPSVKYFTKENFAVNSGFSFSSSKNIYKNSINNTITETKGKAFSINGGFQKYNMIDQKFGLYFGMSASLSMPIAKKPTDTKTTTFSFSPADIGVIYKLNNKFAIEGGGSMARIAYSHSSQIDSDSDGKSNSFDLNFGMPAFSLGFMYLLK